MRRALFFLASLCVVGLLTPTAARYDYARAMRLIPVSMSVSVSVSVGMGFCIKIYRRGTYLVDALAWRRAFRYNAEFGSLLLEGAEAGGMCHRQRQPHGISCFLLSFLLIKYFIATHTYTRPCLASHVHTSTYTYTQL